jgi:hypothetical protein
LVKIAALALTSGLLARVLAIDHASSSSASATMTTTTATKISVCPLDMRHMVRLYVDGPAAGFVSPAPPSVNVTPATDHW